MERAAGAREGAAQGVEIQGEEREIGEIGGYIELDRYRLPMLHEGELMLNTADNGLRFLIRERGIRRILLPDYLCHSVLDACGKEGIEVLFYGLDADFLPDWPFGEGNVAGDEGGDLLPEDTWLYLVDYFGQLPREWVSAWGKQCPRTILDEVQNYFAEPPEGMDALYSCRKFFGVPDGAFLHFAGAGDMEKARMISRLPEDKSGDRMGFLLGRLEGRASDYYQAYQENNCFLADVPVRRMSKLTRNLLHGIDYAFVKKRRSENFALLHQLLSPYNALRPRLSAGAFAYPFLPRADAALEKDASEDGASEGGASENASGLGWRLRQELQKRRIYVPTLWPELLSCPEAAVPAEEIAREKAQSDRGTLFSPVRWPVRALRSRKDSLRGPCHKTPLPHLWREGVSGRAQNLARNLLPLPVDQRYGEREMRYMASMLLELLA